MLRKLGGWNSDTVERERASIDALQCIRVLSFDGVFEGVNDLVSGNFDPENVLILISQDPAENGQVGVRHYGWELGVGSCLRLRSGGNRSGRSHFSRRDSTSSSWKGGELLDFSGKALALDRGEPSRLVEMGLLRRLRSMPPWE